MNDIQFLRSSNNFKSKTSSSMKIIKSINNDYYLISGYASVYNVIDQHNDIIIKGAFVYSTPTQVKLLWQHNHLTPIGIIKSLHEDNYGLKFTGIINANIRIGMETATLIQQGAIKDLSIGIIPNGHYYNKSNQRVITNADLIEISIVTFPANQYAQINYIEHSKSS